MSPAYTHRRKAPVSPPSKGEMTLISFVVYAIIFFYLALILYSFTPYTHNLDEIKVSLLYFFGPILLCAYLFFAAQGKMRLFPGWLLIPLLGYSVILFISTLFAGKPYSWIGWLQQGFHLALLGGLFCAYGLVRDKKDVSRVVLIYILLGLGTTIFGLFHYAGGFSLLFRAFIGEGAVRTPMRVLLYTFMDSRDRMFSTILNREFYASFLVMLIPLSMAYAIAGEKKHFWRYVAIATSLLMVICLYLAHSKASTGAIVMTLLAFFFLYKLFVRHKRIKIPHPWIWIVGFLIIALTLGFFTKDVGPEKFKSMGRSIASRAIIWGGGWDMFLYGPGPDNWYELKGKPPLSARSLLIGCGPGTFRLIFPRYRSPNYHLHDISNVTLFSHNRFLDLLCENGILGFICYMGFVFGFFIMGLKSLIRTQDEGMRIYIIAFLTGIFGILLSNIFTPNSRWTVVSSNLWAVMGLGIGTFYVSLPKLTNPPAADKPINRLPLPSPFIANLLLALMIVILPIVYFSARFAVERFLGAKENNNGLTLVSIAEGYQKEIDTLTRAATEHRDKAAEIQRSIHLYNRARTQTYKAAVESFKKALKRNLYFITTYYKMAHAYNQIGDIENSLKTYHELQRYAPDYSEIHYNLGVINSELAHRTKMQVAKTPGKEKEALLKKAEKFQTTALIEFEIAGKMSNKPQVQQTLGRMLTFARKYKMARKVYEFLHKLEPSDLSHVGKLARLCDQIGDADAALQYYMILFRADPTNEFFSLRIEKHYRDLNRPDEFEAFLKESISVNPLDPLPRLSLIDLYAKKNDHQNARRQLHILTRLPELVRGIGHSPAQRQSRLYKLAVTARKLRDRQSERYFLKKSLQVDAATSIGKTCRRLLKEISG